MPTLVEQVPTRPWLPVGVGELVEQLPLRPGRLAGLVPLLEERQGVLDGQAEAQDQPAGCLEGLVVAALAGHGRRDLAQVGAGPLNSVAGSKVGPVECR